MSDLSQQTPRKIQEFAVWMPYFDNDVIFDASSKLNRDDLFSQWIALKRKFEERNVEVHTLDVYLRRKKKPDAVLFCAVPRRLWWISHKRSLDGVEKYLFPSEPAIIYPPNAEPARRKDFVKIFTWRTRDWEHNRIVPVMFPSRFNKTNREFYGIVSPRHGFCIMIAGHKRAAGEGELYSKRIEAIRWFEKCHPDDFDLYGSDWDVYRFYKPRPLRHLNRIEMLRPLWRWLAPATPSWKGKVADKQDVMKNYKFAICFENLGNEPGFITEKIFDCFLAGCIPVYLGAPNIGDFVPADCFIDAREFPDYEALYQRMSHMSDQERAFYIERIGAYLRSSRADIFLDETFAQTIVDGILNEKANQKQLAEI